MAAELPLAPDWLSALGTPYWLYLLIVGLYVAALIGLAGWVLARTGRSPLWSLLLLVPTVNVVAIWALAYAKWPRFEAGRKNEG
jgi:hypothetical protein